MSAALLSAAILSMAACLFVPGLALAQTTPKIEIVATIPAEPNGQLENIAEGPDGAMYVTAALDRIVWKVKDGKAEKFFTGTANYGVISGVAPGSKDELVIVAATNAPMIARPDGRGVIRNPNAKDPEAQAVVLDKSGKVKFTVASTDPKVFFNGFARAGNDWYLATAGNRLFAIDTKAKTAEPWFMDPMVRTNGIKVLNNWVYLTSADKVYRVKIGPDRKPMGGAVVFAMGGMNGDDDFAIAPDGTLYIPSGKTMLKITPSGERSVFFTDDALSSQFAEGSPGAYVTHDGKWLYWTERFGPAKVKRVALK